MKHIQYKVDFCVIGGGMSGICAAISAARHGARVALMQDRPVLGGNASSEIRMWICGARGDNLRETGLLEEINLENLYRNNAPNFHIWDSILYEKVKFEENITLLLNCTCIEAEMKDNIIKNITGWQLTTETRHTVEAKYFADCSGDSILAPLTGAEYRIGREAASEFNETIEPETADRHTMGMSCLFQIRETDRPQPFIPPSWANKYLSDDDLPFRNHSKKQLSNFWWIELGGDRDSIHDTEELRDELVKIAFGVWDHMKNHGDHGVENWVLDWIGFLPGKRESRRYVGDHILTQNDISAEGKFDDMVAYGGWSMDDHFPQGFNYPGFPTIFHPTPSPYGIPYRCLYSKNIDNLFFAGRNISATHAALSSTRVMATCSMLGQAVGTAAAIAVNKGLTPRGVYEMEISSLKNLLMENDCYLPWHKRSIPELTRKAALTSSNGDPEPLRNGCDRPIDSFDNGWTGSIGDYVEYRFENEKTVKELRFVFDSSLNRKIRNMPCNYPLNQSFQVPETMVKDFVIEAEDNYGNFYSLTQIDSNHQRLVRIPVDIKTKAVRFRPLSTWGSSDVHVFSWDVR